MGVDKSVLCSVLFLLLQTHCCRAQSKMIVPSQSIVVPVGSDVTLPCEVDPVKNLKDLVLEWARPDLKPRYIHIRRDGQDHLIGQNPQYKGRTQLWERGLQIGDMSLKLSRVRLSDGGTYRCFLPQMDTAGEVTLTVVSVSPVAVSLTKDHSGSPVLRCESRGWYPEPELLWLDSDGTVVTGGRTEVQRGVSDETFSVSSRLSEEQSPGNTFTCRVRQQQSRQSRENQITVTGEFLEPCASCVVAWTLFVLGLLVAAATGAFVLWKYKIQGVGRTRQELALGARSDLTEKETVITDGKLELKESEPLLKSEEKAQNDEQKLNEYEEAILKITEELQFMEETEKLSETKDMLTQLKHELNTCSQDLKADIEENQEKINNTKIDFQDKNKTRAKIIQDSNKLIQIFTNIILHTEKEMEKIDEIVLKSAERKWKLKPEFERMTKLLENEKKRLEAAAQPQMQQVPGGEEVKLNVEDENVTDDLCTQFGNTCSKSTRPVNSEEPSQTDEVREEQPGIRKAEEKSMKVEAKEQQQKTEAEEQGSTSGGAHEDSDD